MVLLTRALEKWLRGGESGGLWKLIGAMTILENGVRLDNLSICKVFKILFKTSLFKIDQVKNLLHTPPQKNQPKPFLLSPPNICIAAQGHRTATKKCSTLAGGAPETFGGLTSEPHINSVNKAVSSPFHRWGN